MNRSKSWFFKWINKFNRGGEEWYKSQSKAPKNHEGKINKEIETAVISIRKNLLDGNEHESKYLGVGADTIQYRMHKLDFSDDETPSISTIKRIVKKHKLKVNTR